MSQEKLLVKRIMFSAKERLDLMKERIHPAARNVILVTGRICSCDRNLDILDISYDKKIYSCQKNCFSMVLNNHFIITFDYYHLLFLYGALGF